jgi:RNA-directed DNA polymerase
LLGLTLYWGRSTKGTWVVKRKTVKSRLQRALRRISEWCKETRHLPVSQQGESINQKLRGHYSQHGVTGNVRALELLYEGTKRIWHKWLGRRSNRPLLW